MLYECKIKLVGGIEMWPPAYVLSIFNKEIKIGDYIWEGIIDGMEEVIGEKQYFKPSDDMDIPDMGPMWQLGVQTEFTYAPYAPPPPKTVNIQMSAPQLHDITFSKYDTDSRLKMCNRCRKYIDIVDWDRPTCVIEVISQVPQSRLPGYI